MKPLVPPVQTGRSDRWQTTCRTSILSASLAFLLLAGKSGAEATSAYAGVLPPAYQGDSEELGLDPDGERNARALALYYAGIRHEQRSDFPAAIGRYRESLSEDPRNAELAEKTAHLLAQYGKVEEATELLEDLHARSPDIAALQLALSRFHAIYLRKKGGIEKGIELAAEAVERFPNQPQVLQNHVDLLLSDGKREEAREVVSKALKGSSREARYWLALGRIAKKVWPINRPADRDANLDRINEIYERSLTLASDDAVERTRVGEHFTNTRQWDRAREIYEEIIADRPDLLAQRYRLSKIYGVLDMPQEHLSTLRDVAGINPHDAAVQMELADMLDSAAYKRAAARDYDGAEEIWAEAIDAYSTALRLGAGDLSDHLRLGELLLLVEGDAGEAVNLARRLTGRFPDSAYAHYFKGRALNASDDFEGAIAAFEQTEQMAEVEAPALLNERFYFSYAAAYERREKFEKAVELFKKSLELVPDDQPELGAQTLNYLGYMMVEQGMDLEEAGRHIERANDLRPGSSAYTDSLGWYYFKVGRFEEALEALLRAEEYMDEQELEEPENAVIFDHIGQAYEKVGNGEEALRYIGRAAALDPENGEIADRLKGLRAGEDPGAETPPGPVE